MVMCSADIDLIDDASPSFTREIFEIVSRHRSDPSSALPPDVDRGTEGLLM